MELAAIRGTVFGSIAYDAFPIHFPWEQEPGSLFVCENLSRSLVSMFFCMAYSLLSRNTGFSITFYETADLFCVAPEHIGIGVSGEAFAGAGVKAFDILLCDLYPFPISPDNGASLRDGLPIRVFAGDDRVHHGLLIIVPPF